VANPKTSGYTLTHSKDENEGLYYTPNTETKHFIEEIYSTTDNV
jgi:hypothetical protein